MIPKKQITDSSPRSGSYSTLRDASQKTEQVGTSRWADFIVVISLAILACSLSLLARNALFGH